MTNEQRRSRWSIFMDIVRVIDLLLRVLDHLH